MELIPFITLYKNKIYPGPNTTSITDTELLYKLKSDTSAYFLDKDGVNKDKPNLCLFQKLGTKIQLWADSGPRVLGDIVDTVMTGAQRLTLRPNIWTSNNIENIQEITEQKIFINHSDIALKSPSITANGIVLLDNTPHIKNNFLHESHLKTLTLKTSVYIYDSDNNNYSYWQKLGITGILIDLESYSEYLTNVH
jgi:hypothetical protein